MDILKCINANNTLPDLRKLLKGKNVLIFDLETTGLRMDSEKFGTYKYSCYKDNDKYKNTRILQVGWKYIENWSDLFDTHDIEAYYRKSVDITEINNTHIHGITVKCINEKGKLFKNIINKHGFGYALENTDYIIAHNTKYDVPILLNELNRLGYERKIERIINLIESNRVICTMKYGRKICTGSCKLEKFYEHYYNVLPENTHTADGDVKILLDILNKVILDPAMNQKYEQTYDVSTIKYTQSGEDDKIEKHNVREFYGFCMKMNKIYSNIMVNAKSIFYELVQNFVDDNMQFRNLNSFIVINKKLHVYGSFVSTKLISDELLNNYCKSVNIEFESLNISNKSFIEWEKKLVVGIHDTSIDNKVMLQNINEVKKNDDNKLINHGKKWTDENINELVILAKTNEIDFIANIIGRSHSSVISQVARIIKEKKLNKVNIKSKKLLDKINEHEKMYYKCVNRC